MGSLSSSSLSAARALSPALQAKPFDSCKDAHTFSCSFEYPSKPLECQRLVSSRRPSRVAVFKQRGSSPSQDPSNNESQARLQQTSDDSTSKLEPQEERPSAPSPPPSPPLSHEHEGLVISHGDPDAWDALRVSSPVVRRYVSDNEERWCMWYAGESSTSSSATTTIGIAVSSNGMHWRRGSAKVDTEAHDEEGAAVGQVLDRSDNWWAFDTQHLAPSDVLIMSSAKVRASSGVYWLYYSGTDAENMALPSNLIPTPSQKLSQGRMRPGLAISNDGRNWARVEGDHHSGALFDVGAEGEFDSLFIAAPQVVFHEPGDIRMYYHSFDVKTSRYSVGFARSRDAMRWLKFGKILDGGPPGSFDECGITSRHVVADPGGSGYLMVYEGVRRDGRTSIGMARSEAGLLKWERCGDEAIFEPAENVEAWDGGGVGAPCLVHMDGDEWRLYYVGVSVRGETAIGMAVNVGGSLTEFKRWHNFQPST